MRPEKLKIERADEPPERDWPRVDGVIESSLYLGTATQFVVRLPDGVPMTVLVPNTDEAERQRLPGGGVRVRLTWASEHTHVVKEAEGPALSENEIGEHLQTTTASVQPASIEERVE